MNNIKKIKSLFPTRIPVNFRFSIFSNSFLDCNFYRNVCASSYTTYTRFNMRAPSSIPHFTSLSLVKNKFNSFLCNAIRSYRICNENCLFKLYIESLKYDLLCQEYPEKTIQSIHTRSLNYIFTQLDPFSLTKILPSKTFRYPPSIPYLNNNLHNKLRYIIKTALSNSEYSTFKPPSLKLPRKIKNIFYTKKKHKKLIGYIHNKMKTKKTA